MRSELLVASILFVGLVAPGSGHAQSIAGNWRTQSGETARIAKCGAAYCITLVTGKYKGRRIGRMTGAGASYSGSITDPSNDRSYSGKAQVNGRSMAMSGCVFGGLFCRSQTWTKR